MRLYPWEFLTANKKYLGPGTGKTYRKEMPSPDQTCPAANVLASLIGKQDPLVLGSNTCKTCQ